jgi:hypothetical protein
VYGITSAANVKFQQMMHHGATGAMHVMRTNMLSVLTGTTTANGGSVVVVGGGGGESGNTYV